jgi:hypothetical protein
METYTHPRNDGTPSRRKFKGFNFYIQGNEKLSKKNRIRLLKESEVHLNEVTSSLTQSVEDQIQMGVIGELDSTLTDYELLGQWNQMYDNYGYLMSGFRDQWEKEKIGKKPPVEEPSIIQILISRIEELEQRVLNLEEKTMSSKPLIGF